MSELENETRAARSERFYRIRVAFLLVVLAGVLLYAIRDVRRRRERNDWDHTLAIAVVVLRAGPVDDAAIAALRARLGDLDSQLNEEMQRYRSGRGVNVGGPKSAISALHPFAFTMFGPVDVTAPPPVPTGDSWTELARHSYDLWRYLRPIDAAVNLDSSDYDSRIYVTVRPPTLSRDGSTTVTTVEGASEEDGRVGTVEVELNASMTDFALFVVAHELFHTLGASDKYDAQGRAMVPDGLAEPGRVPLYPQRFVEVMARDRPVSPTEEVIPESLDELRVGSATAREIGWSP